MNKIQSLYIHIPFCEHICDYCDFPKLQYFNNFSSPYLLVLEKEINFYKEKYEDDLTKVKTIYVGGGTPTSLNDEEFLRLLKIIKPFSSFVKEYTFEANPESLSLNKLKMMKEYGVNRLSLGVESTNDKILSNINRHHTFNDVKKAIKAAIDVGIVNINVDLILGLPNSSFSLLKKDLDNLLKLPIKHISIYSLTVHDNTVFSLKKIIPPSDDIMREYYDFCYSYLKKHHFDHYEISNWAKKGSQSIHNFTYWRNEQYFGIGLGASGYIDNVRYTNTRSINDYLKGKYITYKETLDKKDEQTYFILLNLRTNEGINLSLFKNKYNYDFFLNKKEVINKFIQDGLLKLKNNHLIATFDGMMVLDSIILKLI